MVHDHKKKQKTNLYPLRPWWTLGCCSLPLIVRPTEAPEVSEPAVWCPERDLCVAWVINSKYHATMWLFYITLTTPSWRILSPTHFTCSSILGWVYLPGAWTCDLQILMSLAQCAAHLARRVNHCARLIAELSGNCELTQNMQLGVDQPEIKYLVTFWVYVLPDACWPTGVLR